MWKKVAPLLIVLSIALNSAFVGIWTVHAVRAHYADSRLRHGKVWSPLHRQLNVTDEQWREIEPRLADFQKAAGDVRADVNRLRLAFLDLIAEAEPDSEALRAQQDDILALQRRMQELVIEHLLSQKDVLTTAQQRELFDMMRRHSHCIGQGPGMIPLGRRRLEGWNNGS